MKKTIYFSLMILLLLYGCKKSFNELNVKPEIKSNVIQKTDQGSNPGNYSVSHWFTSGYYTPLVCDGLVVDNLSGALNTHCTMHYTNGKLVQMVMIYTGSIASQSTGELFKIKEIDMYDLPHSGMVTFHSNIKGNQGNHIITSAFIDVNTWEIIINKTSCQP
jgi:hypothetical protein